MLRILIVTVFAVAFPFAAMANDLAPSPEQPSAVQQEQGNQPKKSCKDCVKKQVKGTDLNVPAPPPKEIVVDQVYVVKTRPVIKYAPPPDVRVQGPRDLEFSRERITIDPPPPPNVYQGRGCPPAPPKVSMPCCLQRSSCPPPGQTGYAPASPPPHVAPVPCQNCNVDLAAAYIGCVIRDGRQLWQYRAQNGVVYNMTMPSRNVADKIRLYPDGRVSWVAG